MGYVYACFITYSFSPIYNYVWLQKKEKCKQHNEEDSETEEELEEKCP